MFSNILRDTRHSQVRADLQSLTMASSFFATLVPGDGPNSYAGFMTRMSATLERIARIVVEKEEKRSRAPDEEDQEYKPPGAKRHHARKTTQHPKQHRPATSRTPKTSGTAPVQTSNTARQMNFGIPDTLEGLPPVNSSGYVVPMSPGPGSTPNNNSQSSYMNAQTFSPSTTNLDRTFLHEGARTAIPAPIPAWQLSQDFSAAATTPALKTATASPDSYNSNPIPDFFQVPMSGEWDYGGNMFPGLFPAEYSFPPPHPVQADGYPPMPILSAESFMNGAPAVDGHAAQAAGLDAQNLGYGYVPEGQEDVNQGSDSVWSNGFLGLF
jgi:hypothetical protein